ncbi:phosphoribosylformylglycinamidine synthase subunit PurQ [Allofustis seminis]|uniref:phosphoribosylformylglycinamidine synthase subunit PurQ n=1 Tax=Allofustis seminis TaxID=166939 RepID=UPI00035ED631|nr:phosphoribosylformylglycinamidine synthase subunit PurQ [Allofustis seminis]
MKAAIINFSGANGALELAEALNTHTDFTVEHLSDQTIDLSDYGVIFLPGGASYGDYLRPGAVAATTPVMSALKQVRQYATIIGIGNGFQILCEAGLLPGGFVQNESLNFHEELVTIHFNDLKLQLLASAKFGQYVLNDSIKDDQVLMTYEKGSPFGSRAKNIAALCDDTGHVMGVFPHPERVCQSWQAATDGKEVFEWIEEVASRNEGRK